MNRELKFRVWDKNKKEFLKYPCYFNHLNFNEFTCFDRWFKCDEEDCVVQQFTGLQDIKGKDIYEGDIIKVGSNKYKPWDVYWNSKFSCFEPLTDMIFDGCKEKDFEIIGNTFENPELLEK